MSLMQNPFDTFTAKAPSLDIECQILGGEGRKGGGRDTCALSKHAASLPFSCGRIFFCLHVGKRVSKKKDCSLG